MHPHTATATSHASTGAILFLILAVVTAGYLLHCWLYPFRNCPRCAGTGKKRGLFAAFAPCKRCGGYGGRKRLGRYVIDYFRELHRKGDR